MKIALLTDSRAFAGTERHMLDLASALRDLGVDAQLTCPARSELAERARQEGVPVFGLESRGWRALTAVAALRRKLRSGEWDLIHAHNGYAAFLGAVARRLAGRGRLVATQHFIDPARTKRRGWGGALARRVHRWVERQTSAVIAISEAVKEALLRRDGTPPQKVHVVINGLRDPARKPLVAREIVRAGLGLSAAVPLVVCVCRLEPEKSVEVLVRAMPALQARFPDAVCVIGGEGSEQARISGEIARLGLGQTVKLLGFQQDPHSLMSAGTVFVLPSRAEPFGLALVEAMALGCPCVAVAAGGPLEIVEDGVSGLLAAPDDAVALGRVLQRLLAEPELRARLATAARARYEQKFTVGRMGREIAAVYRTAIYAEGQGVPKEVRVAPH